MPLFGIAQSGFNPPPNQGLNVTGLIPGESIVLWDGTETPASNVKSVAFARGYSPSANDGGTTFNLSHMPSDMTVDVQACSAPAGGFASTSAMDAAFAFLTTISPDANGNGAYTDVGRSEFYRLRINAFSTSQMPVAIASR